MKTTAKYLLLLLLVIQSLTTRAQFAYGDHWYTNPLGFKPLNLHTSMGFFVPALAVGTVLLLTKNKEALQNRVSVFNEAGLSWGYKYPETFVFQNNNGVNVMLRKHMSVGAEFDVYIPRDRFNKTIGFAIRPFARFYAINKDSWRLYFESGGGFVYLIDNFPKPTDQDSRLGTHLNGTTKYGIGAEINLNNTSAIMFGIRHLHISNGNTKGVERNPSHDSNGLFFGISRKL